MSPLEKSCLVELLRHGPFPSTDDIHLVSAVDPMGWRATINSESLGRVHSRSPGHCVKLRTATNVDDQLVPSFAFPQLVEFINCADKHLKSIFGPRNFGKKGRHGYHSLIRARLINQVNEAGNELTIWDTRVSRFSVHEEFRKTFPCEDIIRDLDWTSTPDRQSILAVGFPRRVVLFCQQRYDYLNSGSMWISFMSFDMHKFVPG